jgi:hypothetical protein
VAVAQTNDQAAATAVEPGAELSDEQIEVKARELLAQLSLDEKLEMMDGDTSFWPGLAEMMGGGYADHPWNAGVISRPGIPGVRFADGPRGVVMAGATTFPVSIPSRKLRRTGVGQTSAWGGSPCCLCAAGAFGKVLLQAA